VLLHGFPASSHQYWDLIRVLGDRFHVIAPDYPGFGDSDIPDPATYGYTFDKILDVVESFLTIKGFDHYGLFVQDYGGPVAPQPECAWVLLYVSDAQASAIR